MNIIKIDNPEDKEKINKLNEYIKKDENIFVFFYLDGCVPCKETKPAWKNISNKLNKKNAVIAEVNQNAFKYIEGAGSECSGFPCIRYIKKNIIEDYDGERTTNAFVNWINTKIDKESYKKSDEKSDEKSDIGGTRKKQRGGSKTCVKTYCEKYYIPKMLKTEKELLQFLKKTKKNKLSNEELKMIKKFKNKTYKNKNKKLYLEGCERYFCNKGCKGTMFEDGKKLPKQFTQKYRGNKAMLKSFEEQRTFLFKGKNSVLKDDFYKELSEKQIRKLKKNGAESGCVLMPI